VYAALTLVANHSNTLCNYAGQRTATLGAPQTLNPLHTLGAPQTLNPLHTLHTLPYLPARDFGVGGKKREADKGEGGVGGGGGRGGGIEGDVGGEWARQEGYFREIEDKCGRVSGAWECACRIPLRIETLNPAFAYTEGTSVMHVLFAALLTMN
jgi:hypothetical protein